MFEKIYLIQRYYLNQLYGNFIILKKIVTHSQKVPTPGTFFYIKFGSLKYYLYLCKVNKYSCIIVTWGSDRGYCPFYLNKKPPSYLEGMYTNYRSYTVSTVLFIFFSFI